MTVTQQGGQEEIQARVSLRAGDDRNAVHRRNTWGGGAPMGGNRDRA